MRSSRIGAGRAPARHRLAAPKRRRSKNQLLRAAGDGVSRAARQDILQQLEARGTGEMLAQLLI
jgi:hypothetical protein